MQNIYHSNAVTLNKRPNHIPSASPLHYNGKNRFNAFTIPENLPKRLIAESYKASDRNHKIPSATSPLMMTSGVSPKDKLTEFSRTEKKLEAIDSRAEFVLANQGPSPLPLSGKAGAKITLVNRQNSVQLNKQLAAADQVHMPKFRANLYKETLPINLKTKDELQYSRNVKTFGTLPSRFSDAPIVKQTMSQFNRSEQKSFEPSLNHMTSTVSHWRALRGLDSPTEKHQQMLAQERDAYATPTKIKNAVEDMTRTFSNYEAFKRDVSPQANKTHYRQFLSTITASPTNWDSSIGSALEYNKRIIAFKNKEQGLRTLALNVNRTHDLTRENSQRSLDI